MKEGAVVKKVSIMMMSYNSLENVKNTLKSIETQDYPNIEIVISDGGSTDGTVEYIKKFEKKTKYEVNWVSESDKGLFDAMNKDVHRATGDYLLVFNDQLIDKSAITKLVNAIEENDADASHADLVFLDQGQIKRCWKMGQGKITTGWLPAHPTLLLKREVYDKYGDYDTKYRIAADYEFMSRIFKDGSVKLAYVPQVLVRMYYGGASTGGIKNYYNSFMEGADALKKNGYKFPYTISMIRSARVVLQFINKNYAVSELRRLRKERKEM